MGNEEFENKEKFQELCQDFSGYLKYKKYNLKLDEKKNTIIKKIKENAKKNTILSFIRNLIVFEERKRILEEMEEIFLNLIYNYEINHIEENEIKKTFSGNIDENEKNVINAIYISRQIDEDDIGEDIGISIHDYAVKLYDEDEVEKIERGENEYINKKFIKYFYDEIEPTKEEINKKYNEICKEIYIECCTGFLDYFKAQINKLNLNLKEKKKK